MYFFSTSMGKININALAVLYCVSSKDMSLKNNSKAVADVNNTIISHKMATFSYNNNVSQFLRISTNMIHFRA